MILDAAYLGCTNSKVDCRMGWTAMLMLLVILLSASDVKPDIRHAEMVLASEEVARMAEKLDPRLLEAVESADAGSGDSRTVINVLVGLDAPLDDAGRKELVGKGLTLRSEIGTVLTGSILLKDVVSVAESPRVVKLEMSGPLYPEKSKGGIEEAGE